MLEMELEPFEVKAHQSFDTKNKSRSPNAAKAGGFCLATVKPAASFKEKSWSMFGWDDRHICMFCAMIFLVLGLKIP